MAALRRDKPKKERPNFGPKCVKCGGPIHRSYKSPIEGYCGKCTDEVKKQFLAGTQPKVAVQTATVIKSGGGGRLVIGLFVGIVVGLLVALVLGIFAQGTFEKILQAIRGALGL
jgi:hypothetical protein